MFEHVARSLSLCRAGLACYYLRQGGNVFAGFCLSVSLCVSKITQKVMDGSF